MWRIFLRFAIHISHYKKLRPKVGKKKNEAHTASLPSLVKKYTLERVSTHPGELQFTRVGVDQRGLR